MYIIIMAGGQGTRLWPMSRQSRPKQLFDLVSDQSMLKDTIDRLTPDFPIKNIFIATNHRYVDFIKKEIPQFPAQNILSEPSLRDTSACIGLATLRIMKIDPQANIAVLPSDHFIRHKKKFREILQKADKLATRENKIIILGIKPTRPATEFGYINISKSAKSIDKYKVFQVKKFVEKPDLPTAKKYVTSWKYFWNAGMFIYPATVMMKKIAHNMPSNYKIFQQIDKIINTKQEKKLLADLYDQLEKISIDYGIMEKSPDLLVIPADIGWNDIGNWSALKDVLSDTNHANVTKGNLISIDTQGSLIYGSKKPIATIGVKNMIIVDTDDILFVCPKNKSADIKKIINYLKESNQDHFL
ncbi:MAG TPA: mannose-1-phosphate guanylyltransferase [bacterium]|nr:mannose-1-phosphate guanylyltransferase [bacterium]HPN67710.1 mannose-1-phosphate guanylyltransferase [bacterium]